MYAQNDNVLKPYEIINKTLRLIKHHFLFGLPFEVGFVIEVSSVMWDLVFLRLVYNLEYVSSSFFDTDGKTFVRAVWKSF